MSSAKMQNSVALRSMGAFGYRAFGFEGKIILTVQV